MGLASRSTVLLLLSWVSLCISTDQLSPAKPLIFPDGKLISNNGVFALGFFSPTNSSTRFYIGIWYNNDPAHLTVVWVANRGSPIVTPSSATLAVTNRSDLVLSDTRGRIYWTTTNNITATGTGGTAAALLDDKGNLVLRSSEGATLWQSFDHPTDTILPGMPVWVNYRTRFTQSQLVSWRSPEDPSAGDFSLGADVSSGIQYVLKDGPRLLWRSGAWNGEMVLDYTPNNSSTVIIMSIVTNGDDISLMFSVSDGSPSMYVRVIHTGRYEFTVWNRTAAAWTVLEAHPGAGCDRYAACGPFGYCDATEASPACKCPDGFERDGTSPSGGCTRKEPLRCGGGDYFATLPGVKTPAMPVFVRNRSFDGCTAECRGNCSCTAYAYTNLSTAISGGDMSRCLLWFGELVDIAKDVNIDGENLYLRLAGSSTVPKKSNLVKIFLPITTFVLLLAFAALVWTYKYRGTRRKKKVQKRLMLQYLRSTDETGDKNIEFPFISFDDIVAATDNFSDANMLGKGGFGKVYKGLLAGTNEVAVKRLSKSSGQGTEEFRNEVVLIAKLQHKNLVRLLGCCIHQDEKLLVYEYLPNKSLDYFLFDSERNLMLQWPTRFKIIKGVARGMMYLHHDSRLTIIHRDLKASNILLDKEMIPKISDFGMARIFGGDLHEANTNRVVGT
ncbi:G-type lectin S-receptor-like serine/threonine-protein kinase B120 isoform X2 [Panicum virgatum]|nr:G-type lectin S-receptor-like serine/threonine-protein kinase B120 isoform X2 [Panicum virgatum]KAG2569070.1 hypothetical protein PVAP13_7NG369775 [Panicum virgatum]